jgi:hypothetical protein
LWSERRKADKTALVSLRGNAYQVDAWLAGRTVELLFDPFDLDRVEVRLAGKPAGTAVPFAVSRHRHPKTRVPDSGQRTEPAPAGIDYLVALGDSHDAALREQVSYRSLIQAGRRRKEKPVSDSPDRTLALARSAAEAVRSLNHATLGGNGLSQPADACEVLGDLSLAAAGLPQLLGQVGRWLASALAAGLPGCDDGTEPAAAVSGAWLFISDARSAATALASDLGNAQQQLAAIHGSPAPEEEKERS